MRGVDLIGSGSAGLYANLVLVFSAIIAVKLLSEFFSIYHLSAMIFVFGGIGLFEYQNMKKTWVGCGDFRLLWIQCLQHSLTTQSLLWGHIIDCKYNYLVCAVGANSGSASKFLEILSELKEFFFVSRSWIIVFSRSLFSRSSEPTIFLVAQFLGSNLSLVGLGSNYLPW